MKRIVVNMQNYLMSQAIETALKQGKEFGITAVESPEQVAENCLLLSPDVLLMEVTGSAQWKLEARLKIRNEVKTAVPECKIALIVDENTEKEAAEQIKKAKKDGLIDLFIFGSSSINFLIALMETV